MAHAGVELPGAPLGQNASMDVSPDGDSVYVASRAGLVHSVHFVHFVRSTTSAPGTPGDDVIAGLGGDDRVTGLAGRNILAPGSQR